MSKRIIEIDVDMTDRDSVVLCFPEGHAITISPRRVKSVRGPADGLVLKTKDPRDRLTLSSGMHGEIFVTTMRMVGDDR